MQSPATDLPTYIPSDTVISGVLKKVLHSTVVTMEIEREFLHFEDNKTVTHTPLPSAIQYKSSLYFDKWADKGSSTKQHCCTKITLEM